MKTKSKVCQQELNPHSISVTEPVRLSTANWFITAAYIYSGHATRMALATGLNRLSHAKFSDPRSPVITANTWW
jgi:hypothetical protein